MKINCTHAFVTPETCQQHHGEQQAASALASITEWTLTCASAGRASSTEHFAALHDLAEVLLHSGWSAEASSSFRDHLRGALVDCLDPNLAGHLLNVHDTYAAWARAADALVLTP